MHIIKKKTLPLMMMYTFQPSYPNITSHKSIACISLRKKHYLWWWCRWIHGFML